MMKNRYSELEGRGLIPPYGPTRGTIQALELMHKTTPPRIDSDYLRLNKIAPGNEYKAVGALKFLGLVDTEGKPTELSNVLKTTGAAYTLGLQDIVLKAYSDIFNGHSPNKVTREEIYYYFVISGLGSEMAIKATRFLIKLCRQAEIEIAPDEAQSHSISKRRSGSRQQANRKHIHNNARHSKTIFNIAIAVTPETANMNDEELIKLLSKVRRSFEASIAN